MSIALAKLNYAVGSPGMVATHGYKHSRQHVSDSKWINTTTNEFQFGTAAMLNAGVIKNTQDAAALDFIGVFMENEKFIGSTGYKNKEMLNVLTMGDIWVRVNPAITINFLDKVCLTVAAIGGFFGTFTNVAPAAGVIAVPNARFLTENVNGIAVIGLSTWKGNP